MSVILTSGKAAAAKLRGTGKKPKKVHRPRTAVPVDSYLPTEETAVWNTRIEGTHFSVALNKDSLEVWCNDQLLKTVNDFSDTGSTVDFEVGSKKARINIVPGSRGTKYEFSLEGIVLPPAKAPPEHKQQQQQQQQQLSSSCNGALGFDYAQFN